MNRRMALAADLSCRPDETAGSVAEKVGYATPFAFSAAFRLQVGLGRVAVSAPDPRGR